MELPKSHVHRLLQSLLQAQLIDKDDKSRYRIGVGALRLGHELLRNIPIRQVALPEMVTLVRECPVNMTLALPYADHAISVAHVTHDGEIRGAAESLGSVLQAHASASGKLFLAYKDQLEIEKVVARLSYVSLGPNTHRNAQSLKKDLAQIRSRDYSISRYENGPSVFSFALPIRNLDGEVIAALGAHFKPEIDFDTDDMMALKDRLLQSIQRIETNIQKETEE